MSRKTRFHQKGTLYHVMLRGNNGDPIFFSDEDRGFICFLLQESIQKFDHSIYAFCLMNNHIHLAIKVNETSISCIMQNIAFRYTHYINKKYDRVGHLFQGRFKSVMVDANAYFLELIRYIHLNPVRAKLVENPKDYRWSSYRAYCKLIKCSWLNINDVLRRFGRTFNEALKNFEEYVLRGIGLVVPSVLRNEVFVNLSDDEMFLEEIVQGSLRPQKKIVKLTDIVEKICNEFKISQEVLIASGKNREISHVRAILALLIRDIENISTEELAEFLKRDSSSLCKLVNRLEKKCLESLVISSEIEDLRNKILEF
jgi:putative transposase